MLEDEELQSRFRMIAYDLPFHGKSVPPTGKAWWREEYRLTKAFFHERSGHAGRRPWAVRVRPTWAVQLAATWRWTWPCITATVSAPSSALKPRPYTPGGFIDEFYHPEISNDFKASLMYGLMAPTSPEALRHETRWVYSQGAPAVFKGDLYY